jgi:hypothetical protein
MQGLSEELFVLAIFVAKAPLGCPIRQTAHHFLRSSTWIPACASWRCPDLLGILLAERFLFVGVPMPQNPLTLTRQTLYDLVWSKPMSELAKEFRMSDVGLAKRCRAVDVPIPYRGYWARKTAGQEPPRTPLPKYRSRTPTATAEVPKLATTPKTVVREGPEPTVRFGIPTDAGQTGARSTADNLTEAQAFQHRVAELAIKPAATIADACPAVRRTARHAKHADRKTLSFARGEREGPIINLDVTDATLNRSLLLADLLVRTAQGLGWTLDGPPRAAAEPGPSRSRWDPPAPTQKPEPPIAHLLVDDEPIAFCIEERLRVEARQPTPTELAREKREYGYHAPRSRQISTGALRVVRIEAQRYWSPKRKSWYDHRSRLVETQIPKIMASFHELALELKAKRAEAERQQQIREEQERLRQERLERRAAHARLISDLERQAGAWYRARILRRYVQAARRTLAERRVEAKFRDQTVDFLDWAISYVDQLDPLSAAPHNPDQAPEISDYPRPDEDAFRKLLLRLTGLDGRPIAKLDTTQIVVDHPSDDEDVFNDLESN